MSVASEEVRASGTKTNAPADRPEVTVLGQDVVPPVDREAKAGVQLLLRRDKAHGEDDEVGGEDLLRPGLLLETLLPRVLVRHEAHAHGLDATNGVAAAALTALHLCLGQEALRHHAVLARVGALHNLGLAVAVVHVEDARPLGPGVVARALGRRPREQLKVDNVFAAVADRCADAVRARVATADDDDLFALGADELRDGRAGGVVPGLDRDSVSVACGVGWGWGWGMVGKGVVT